MSIPKLLITLIRLMLVKCSPVFADDDDDVVCRVEEEDGALLLEFWPR